MKTEKLNYSKPLDQHVKVEPYSLTAAGGGQRKTHPAFGMVQFIRSGGAGSGRKFFGSEIGSGGTTFTLQIVRGEQIWELSESRFFGSATPLIEVEMTAAQFVQLLTTMNQGSGVPCTLRRAHLNAGNPDIVPGIIDDQTTHQLMQDDLKSSVSGVVAEMTALVDELKTTLEDSSVPKKKKEELVRKVEHVKMQVASNMPFLLTQYQWALDKQKSAHLAEVDARHHGHDSEPGHAEPEANRKRAGRGGRCPQRCGRRHGHGALSTMKIATASEEG